MTTQANRWCFTFNNAPVGWAPPTGSEVLYMIWQREKGAAGTEHVQGYVRFQGRKRLSSAKKWFSVQEIHLEPAKGSEAQNRAYCSKEATRIGETLEFGEYDETVAKQGQRTDLETIAKDLIQGRSLRDVALEHPGDYIRYSLGLEKFQQLVQPPPPLEREVLVQVLWGPTGTGKTHRARIGFPEAYEVMSGRDPWGGYQGQTTVIFDEYNADKWSIQDMNRYCDKWRCTLDCRYHNKYAGWTLVVICSNSDPWSWWPQEHQELRAAFWRRIQAVEVKSKEQVVELGVRQVAHSP